MLDTNENEVIITELKTKVEDVIPLGFICEDFIFQFSNNEFDQKASYRLRKNKKINFDKVQYMATSQEPSNNQIRDYASNQDIFLVTAVMTQNHLPD